MADRIVVMDGAIGTMLRRLGTSLPLDALNIDAPSEVAALHRDYLGAGADIVTTNTFAAAMTALHGPEGRRLAIARSAQGARLARAAVDAAQRDTPSHPRWVTGTVGPVHCSGLVMQTVPNAEELAEAYRIVIGALLDGGADLLVAETLFDAKNLDAVVQAIETVRRTTGHAVPVLLSATVTEDGGLVGGQPVAAFWCAAARAAPLAVGLNCGFGAQAMRGPLTALAGVAASAVSIRPNAGLPLDDGTYPDGPQTMAAVIRALAEQGQVNIVGGCCGTTPAHVAALAAAVAGIKPRVYSGAA